MSASLPLTAEGITVHRRGRRLLGPVDLSVGPSGITVVLGPNGAGKTTLLRALHGLERLSGGTISWQVPAAAARRRQAFVFQTPILLRRTVRGNLSYPLWVQGMTRQDTAQRVADWAGRIGLSAALDRQANRLSGGEKQKLALARALITAPELLFLDEPCTNLDGRATREIEEMLMAAREAGTRVLLATHDLGQARRLADDTVFLTAGKIAEAGPAATLFENPATPALAAFLRGDIVE